MLLYATLSVRRRKMNIPRGVFAALLGAICAAAYPIVPSVAKIAIKVALAPLICLVCATPVGKDAKRKAGDFIGTMLIFILLTFFTGGVVYGISYAIGMDVKSYAALGFMAIAVIALILCAKLIAFKRSVGTKSTCNTTLQIGNKTERVQALCDSGNLLVDDVSGLPIVLLSQEIEDRLNARKLAGFINVNTVSG
ncbi:MAG: sigma-E processing peptidase SpoIIGA, partial [[Eubacterium] siraeum]|nr:sigma-E processing peptidase SpoIIGA [[Eubacterium] siraeum]